jgi:hypothetical protein
MLVQHLTPSGGIKNLNKLYHSYQFPEFIPSNVARPAGRFRWTVRARWVAPTLREINKRKKMVAADNIIRFGSDKIPRRSEFLDWSVVWPSVGDCNEPDKIKRSQI